MDVVVRTLVDTAPGGDGLVRRRVEMPEGSAVEAAAGPGGELWFVIDGRSFRHLDPAPDQAIPSRRGIHQGAYHHIHAPIVPDRRV